MSMKTILVPTENHDAMRSALETAPFLARRRDSYIEGFALHWQINEFAGVDMMGGLPLDGYAKDIEEEAKKHANYLSHSCRSTTSRARQRR